jgi:hypothetical protein
LLQIPPFEIAALAKQGSPRYWKFPRLTPGRELHVTFRVPYVNDYKTKLCSQQAEVIMKMQMLAISEKGEARHRKYKRLKLGGGQAYDRSSN